MQREALIGLTVFLTLAVLGGGQQPEPANAAQHVQAPEPAFNIVTGPASLESATEEAVCAVENALKTWVGPLRIQLVGSGDNETASLRVELDVAM